ncbi:ATP-grasp domain-containing protein [Musicola paradisiaca]|uniref:ATP-grasp domain-containing protein n=1 Tax=Musicola paradisiaca TaxID=69223 RepID=UPI0003C7F00B|nr:ATP-grasp domain-containing protein [Musicola paradisiaca]
MKKVAVVDGFSSGKFIAKELHHRGCELVHISSSAQLDDYYYNGFDFSIYENALVHDVMDQTLAFIKKFGAEVIIAGAESGVMLADQLNHALALPYQNDFAKTSARRNKFDMIETLRAGGLKAAQQIAVSTWQDAQAWLDAQHYPVVLKPLESAGSDGVFICNSREETQRAFEQISKKKNKLNIINEAVLFQEYLKGTEYVVNFVSLAGNILVTEMVKYHKKKLDSGNIVYDIDEIIDASYPEFNALADYTRGVCACLGIKNGPSHAEVMLTADGPCLVEIAARSDGILRPDVACVTTGLGQLLATAIAITDPEKFMALTVAPYYRLKNHSFNVCLISPEQAVFAPDGSVSQLQTLGSFKKVEMYVADGNNVEQTKDVFSQPGTVYLVSHQKEQLWQDYATIRGLESAGAYYQHA